MQTASQVPHVPVPVPPPMAPAPVHADDSSNRLGTTSLVLGLIVALPILVLLVLNTYGARIQLQYKVNMAAYRTILNYIFGLIGLIAMFTGVVSLERMASRLATARSSRHLPASCSVWAPSTTCLQPSPALTG